MSKQHDTPTTVPAEGSPARAQAPAPAGISPHVLRQAHEAAPMPPVINPVPHPAKCSLHEYLSARWEFVKAKLPMQMSEVLGISDPQVQSELSDIWARAYFVTRMAALEGAVQDALRRSETYRRALEMAVPEAEERDRLCALASKGVPEQFDKLPE